MIDQSCNIKTTYQPILAVTDLGVAGGQRNEPMTTLTRTIRWSPWLSRSGESDWKKSFWDVSRTTYIKNHTIFLFFSEAHCTSGKEKKTNGGSYIMSPSWNHILADLGLFIHVPSQILWYVCCMYLGTNKGGFFLDLYFWWSVAASFDITMILAAM